MPLGRKSSVERLLVGSLCSRGPRFIGDMYKGHLGVIGVPVFDAEEILEEPVRQGDRFYRLAG